MQENSSDDIVMGLNEKSHLVIRFEYTAFGSELQGSSFDTSLRRAREDNVPRTGCGIIRHLPCRGLGGDGNHRGLPQVHLNA
jgi:hypothetical protein